MAAAPINKYGYLDRETHDCIVGIEQVKTGITNMWGAATYDALLIQILLVAFFSFLTNMFMLQYYATHVQHPKFCIRWQRRWCLYIHMLTGTIEIFTGPIVSFLIVGPEVEYVVKANAIISIVHAATALYQVPIVFGVHIFMQPAYLILITIKVACAVNVYLNPFCYLRILVLYNVLSTYSWCRVLILIFAKLKIFPGSSYSVGIASAGAVTLTSAGPAVSLWMLLGCIIYIWVLRLLYGKDNWKFQHLLGESSSNPFDNSAFESLFKEAHGSGGLCPFAPGDTKRSEEDQTNTERDMLLRPLFHQIDVNGDGLLTLSELKQFALNVKQPKLYSTIVKSFHSDVDQDSSAFFGKKRPSEVEPTIDYDRFRQLAQGTVHNHKVPGLVDRMNEIKLMSNSEKKDENKAKLVFDIIDREVNGFLSMQELGVVLIEFGLPYGEVKEVFRSFDSNHDGKLEYNEFKTNFRPLWRYAYNVFEKRLESEKELSRRSVRVADYTRNMLDEEREVYLADARKKSKIKREREAQRESQGNARLHLSTGFKKKI
mmetsp:Transcript_17022/g.21766  ORF Transcript_17022/g.21766 Transcript_17022/m.21766 type:complete len:543 (-) Transcript_17022:1780-3408(-)